MRTEVGKKLLWTVVVSLLLAGAAFAGGESHRRGPAIEAAWIRQAPPVARVMAGYMTLRNPSDEVLILRGAESPFFEKVEIHRTRMKGGMAGMMRQELVEIPPHGELEFAPGGLHLMLTGPKRPLGVGDAVTITLLFDGGHSLPVRFTVRPLEGMERSGNHQHH